MKVEKMKFISREIVRQNPEKLFLFGDNLRRQGFGGQAKEMRGEPNTQGMITKIAPTRYSTDYLTDELFDRNCYWIDGDFAEIELKIKHEHYTTIVIPEDGIGTGLAELDRRAPKTFAYLQKRLAELEG
jgi:hypothetical protein